jgi:hypothetical protein
MRVEAISDPPCMFTCVLLLQITFDWGWSKGPLSGSGFGELSLQGGALDEIFLVRAWQLASQQQQQEMHQIYPAAAAATAAQRHTPTACFAASTCRTLEHSALRCIDLT